MCSGSCNNWIRWNIFHFYDQHGAVWTDMTRRNVKCVIFLNLIRDVFSFNRGCATVYDRITWFYWVTPRNYGGKLTRFGQRRFPSTSLPVNSLFRNNHMSHSSLWYELITLLAKPYIKQYGRVCLLYWSEPAQRSARCFTSFAICCMFVNFNSRWWELDKRSQ